MKRILSLLPLVDLIADTTIYRTNRVMLGALLIALCVLINTVAGATDDQDRDSNKPENQVWSVHAIATATGPAPDSAIIPILREFSASMGNYVWIKPAEEGCADEMQFHPPYDPIQLGAQFNLANTDGEQVSQLIRARLCHFNRSTNELRQLRPFLVSLPDMRLVGPYLSYSISLEFGSGDLRVWHLDQPEYFVSVADSVGGFPSTLDGAAIRVDIDTIDYAAAAVEWGNRINSIVLIDLSSGVSTSVTPLSTDFYKDADISNGRVIWQAETWSGVDYLGDKLMLLDLETAQISTIAETTESENFAHIHNDTVVWARSNQLRVLDLADGVETLIDDSEGLKRIWDIYDNWIVYGTDCRFTVGNIYDECDNLIAYDIGAGSEQLLAGPNAATRLVTFSPAADESGSTSISWVEHGQHIMTARLYSHQLVMPFVLHD